MRFNREIATMSVLVVVFVAATLLLTASPSTSAHLVGDSGPPDPSIYNDRASGSRACFEWVRTLGCRPVAWRRPWRDLGHSPSAVMLVIDPRAAQPFGGLTDGNADAPEPSALTAQDAADLRTWLATGRTAVLMTSRLAGNAGKKHSDNTSFEDALGLSVDSALVPGRTEFGPLQPVSVTRDVLSVYSNSDMRLRRAAPDALALFGDSNGPLILSLPVGKGRLVIIADAGFASNRNLARSDNGVFLAHLLAKASAQGLPVLFDEYHHGSVDGSAGRTLWSALGRPLQLIVLQLLVAGLALVGVVAVRFGRPIPLERGTARQTTDYISSLADLYRRAQASPAALETLYREFLRSLTEYLSLPPDANLEQLADAAAGRAGMDKSRLRRLLESCETCLDAGKVSEPDLLAIVRQMEDVKKEIGIA